MAERRSVVTTVVARCNMRMGGSFNLRVIKLVPKFWCNWQIRQSLHPVWPPLVFAVCSDLVSEVISVLSVNTRPCRCAASTVVPYRMKAISSSPSQRENLKLWN